MSRTSQFHSILCAVALAAPLFGQVTAVLEPSKDNTLYEDLAGATSNGRGQYLFAGRTGFSSFIHRGLLAFDIAGNLPAGATIVSVQLSLTMSRSNSGPSNVALHRLTADWGEGASAAFGNEGSGTGAAPGDATWTHRFFNTTPWATVGGDFAATASVTASVGFPGNYSWSSSQMAADVQSWLNNPAGNFGWIVRGDEATFGSSKRFNSRDNIDPTTRPRLTVVFTTTRAAVIATGSGCSGTNPAPFTLGAAGRPTLGNTGFALSASNGPAGQFGLVLYTLRFLPAPLPFSLACPVWVDPLALLLVASGPLDGTGAASYPTPIPNDPSLTGAGLVTQGLALDGAAPGGLVLSNALTLVLGT